MINQSDAHAYLAAIVTSSDDAIISKDLNGNVTSWNNSAERIFGFTAEEAIGKHISIVIAPEYLKDEDYILGRVRAGLRIDHFETVRRHKSGRPVNVSITVSPIRDNNGTIVGASKVARDISHRIKIEAALRDLSAKKDDFLATISHELRTPMNAVIGLTGLLQHSKTLSDKDKKFVDTLKVSADSLMELIDDLLDFSKLEASSVELEETEFNLAEQVQNAVSIIEVKAQEKKLSLHVAAEIAADSFYIGDPTRFRQILMNLLSNAVKFTERGGVDVHVTEKQGAMPDKGVVTVRVKDSGVGIAYDK